MIVVFFGPPASGKGTQARLIANRFGWQHISTGDVLRGEVQKGSELGSKVETLLAEGQLVPDEIVTAIVADRLVGENGIVLDGFPRTLSQARSLDVILEERGRSVDYFMAFTADRGLLEQRMIGRSQSETRADDDINVFRDRYDSFLLSCSEIQEYYRLKNKLRLIDASVSVNEVTESIFQVLKD
jgi:adenylate kinase